jgi:hypothetical protein
VSRRIARGQANFALWAGMYATHLGLWSQAFAREQFHVIQYESLARDPEAIVSAFWRRLGLNPVPLGNTTIPSATSSRPGAGIDPAEVPGLPDTLELLYRPEVDRLEAEWSIDRSLWTNFPV